MAGPRDPSMEDILASIKRVIAEEKEIRSSAPRSIPDEYGEEPAPDEDVLELDPSMEADPAPEPLDLGPPLMEEQAADSSRQQLEALATIAATAPPPPANPMEEMVREMLRPLLKQWLDDHLPGIVDEHVKREIHRITGRPV
jgi:cell pole-organizing protein PopZ